MKPPKIRLTAYEVMMLLGNFNPKLSEQLKAALDQELKGPACQGLAGPHAFGKACRTLALEHPEVFDPANRDDCAMQRLAPLVFDDNGVQVDFNTFRERIEIHNVNLAFHKRGKDGLIHVAARDEAGPPLEARIAVKLRPAS
ncbi:MAG: hypothetical protein KIT22_08105 [Verrucomicrobiae bacterium]|nr:hypothetical protein [Verrucomicrobiae bacterium]